jgi:hypothetical protein
MRGSEEKKDKSMKVQGTSVGSIFGGAKELRFFVRVKKENFASRQSSSTYRI